MEVFLENAPEGYEEVADFRPGFEGEHVLSSDGEVYILEEDTDVDVLVLESIYDEDVYDDSVYTTYTVLGEAPDVPVFVAFVDGELTEFPVVDYFIHPQE